MTNIDFKAWGLTGRQPEWSKIQGVDVDSLLQVMVDSSVENETDLVIVPSMRREKIVKGSVHDNHGQLMLQGPSLSHTSGYHGFDVMGKNGQLFSIIKDNNRRVSFLTSQVVQTILPSTSDELDLLVVGANDFVPLSSPLDVCMEARDRGLVVVADQRFVLSAEGRKWLYDNKDKFDAILGHYALNCIPHQMAKGPLANFDRVRNTACITFANLLNKSWVSGSGAKRPEWTGKGHTYLDVNPLDGPEKLLADIGSYLREENVGHHHNYGGLGYVNPISAVLWGFHFKKGLASGLG